MQRPASRLTTMQASSGVQHCPPAAHLDGAVGAQQTVQLASQATQAAAQQLLQCGGQGAQVGGGAGLRAVAQPALELRGEESGTGRCCEVGW